MLDNPVTLHADRLIGGHEVPKKGIDKDAKTKWDLELLRKVAFDTGGLEELASHRRLAAVNMIIVFARFEIMKRVWKGDIADRDQIPEIDSEELTEIVEQQVERVLNFGQTFTDVVQSNKGADFSLGRIEQPFVLCPKDIQLIIQTTVGHKMQISNESLRLSNNAVETNVLLSFYYNTMKELGFSDSLLQKFDEFREIFIKYMTKVDPKEKNELQEKCTRIASQLLSMPEGEVLYQVLNWATAYSLEVQNFASIKKGEMIVPGVGLEHNNAPLGYTCEVRKTEHDEWDVHNNLQDVATEVSQVFHRGSAEIQFKRGRPDAKLNLDLSQALYYDIGKKKVTSLQIRTYLQKFIWERHPTGDKVEKDQIRRTIQEIMNEFEKGPYKDIDKKLSSEDYMDQVVEILSNVIRNMFIKAIDIDRGAPVHIFKSLLS